MTKLEQVRCRMLRDVRRKVLAQAVRHDNRAWDAQRRGDMRAAHNERDSAELCRDSAGRYLEELNALEAQQEMTV